MNTKVFIDSFKGSKIFAVWEVDSSGAKIGQYPLFSMGSKKAFALMHHLEEFKQYAHNSATHMERSNENKIDISN